MSDLFSRVLDEEVAALWQAGANLDQVAAHLGVPVMRACHEENRILNARTEGLDFRALADRPKNDTPSQK